MNNSATGQYFVVEFCLFNEESVRNLTASLYLHLYLDFVCADFCMLVKGKFPWGVEQLNVNQPIQRNF